MQHLSDVARPGLMLSQTWPNSREREGHTLEALEMALKEDFFEAFQCVEIPYQEERRKIAGILHALNLPLTYCLARVLNDHRLNLSDVEPGNRQKSYEKVIHCLDDAREAGARAVSFISGPKPAEAEKRQDALKALQDSLIQICRAAQDGSPLAVILEPLDISAHKKGTLGTTQEASGLCDALGQEGLELRLCLDTAHMILNGEDPVDALRSALPYVEEFHYCNCVTEPSHPFFGDRHLPFGPSGEMDQDRIGAMMRASLDMGFFETGNRPAIFCEVLKREQDDSLQLMQHCREIMQQAWARAIDSQAD